MVPVALRAHLQSAVSIARAHVAELSTGKAGALTRDSHEWAAACALALDTLHHTALTRVLHECSTRIMRVFDSMSIPGAPDAAVWRAAGDVAVAFARREAERALRPAAHAMLKAEMEQYYE